MNAVAAPVADGEENFPSAVFKGKPHFVVHHFSYDKVGMIAVIVFQKVTALFGKGTGIKIFVIKASGKVRTGKNTGAGIHTEFQTLGVYVIADVIHTVRELIFVGNDFIGEPREKLVTVYFNNHMEMIDICVISTVTVIASTISVRKIAEVGFAKNAASFVLAHNHPDGSPIPSSEDIAVTNEYASLFSQLGMPLGEHFIIGGSSYCTVYSMEDNFFKKIL